MIYAQLQGHDGIVHGGLLATLMDESLARTVRSSACPQFHCPISWAN